MASERRDARKKEDFMMNIGLEGMLKEMVCKLYDVDVLRD
jgi:hypothetical protein